MYCSILPVFVFSPPFSVQVNSPCVFKSVFSLTLCWFICIFMSDPESCCLPQVLHPLLLVFLVSPWCVTVYLDFWSLVFLFCCQPFMPAFLFVDPSFFWFYFKSCSLFSDCLPRCLVLGSFFFLLNNLAVKSLWLDDLRGDMVGRCSGKHFLHETPLNKFRHDVWKGTMLQGTFLLKRSRKNYITKTISTLP